MKRKIKVKDLSLENIKNNYDEIYKLDYVLGVVFSNVAVHNSEKALENCKKTIPNELLETEIEIEIREV